MIIESHWRVVKHDFLHKFNRSRINLICWALISRLVPEVLERMSASLNNNHQHAKATWRKEFKRQWKSLRSTKVEPQSLQEYHTDPDLSNPALFFLEVRRKRQWLFWVGKQLSLRLEHRILDSNILTGNSNQILDDDPNFNSDYGSDGDSVEANVVESEDENDGGLAQSDDETQEIDVKDCVSIKLAIASLLEE
ncbi:hypothetical protein K3495_g15643 [Podosphaera aphanis]|nr:hypothetical protein K3495_g15643 [Podosphaera aphanis]